MEELRVRSTDAIALKAQAITDATALTEPWERSLVERLKKQKP